MSPKTHRPRFSVISLVYQREMRDQLRDRRTVFTILILPLVLYPLLGSLLLQVAQFTSAPNVSVCVVGASNLPAAPALLTTDGTFSPQYGDDAKGLQVVLQPEDRLNGEENPDELLREWVRSNLFHVVLKVAEPKETGSNIELKLIHDVASDNSRAAHQRLINVIARWRDACVIQRLEKEGLDSSVLAPVHVESLDIGQANTTDATFWSRMLPFVMLIWALTGAFYPAIDLVAGEKERGTLETLLCSPALREEIVIGKMAAVTTFSVMTAVLNVTSMLVTSMFVARQVFTVGGMGGPMGPPAIGPLMWLLLALLPLSALFSALALAVAAIARSSKEGQYYLMPLMMLALPLVMLPMLPGTQLNAGNSLIPVSGMFLLTRALMDGQYFTAIAHLPMVAGVTGMCLYLSTRWAKRQFEDESTLFRGGDQWSMRTWVRHLLRDRSGDATVGQAYGCAAIIIVGLFFAKMVVTSNPHTFEDIARLVMVPQLGLILAPPLLMACVLTKSLRRSLNLSLPSWSALPIAVLLGVCLHPTYAALGDLIQAIYPLSPQTVQALAPFEQMVNAAPLLPAIIVLALVPAICEELAFRGFIFNGLRHNKGGFRAVLVTSVLFGMSHGVLQQSIAAGIMGVLLGWITLRSGSVLPALLVHVTNNAMSVSIGRVDVMSGEWTEYFFRTSGDSTGYGIAWTLISAAIALSCVIYFSLLRDSEDAEVVDVAANHSPARAMA